MNSSLAANLTKGFFAARANSMARIFILNLSFFGSDFREIALRGFFIRSTFHLTQP